MSAAEEQHDDCNHPVEIADVQSSIKRRAALLISAVGLIGLVLGSVVGIAMFAASLNSDVTHLQVREIEDRGAATKANETRQEADRAIIKMVTDNERANAIQHGELIRSTTAIETHLKIIADDSKRRR